MSSSSSRSEEEEEEEEEEEYEEEEEEEEEEEAEEEEEDDEEDDQTGLVGRIGEPSSSRMRSSNGVWPEPFVEALATRVAIDAAAENGRLAAARAMADVFQVCSTWFAVSRSELLWQNLTRRIWARNRCLRDTWHDEYVHLHLTASNFRFGRAAYTPLIFDSWSPSESNDSLSCIRVALSERHLACGFLDGSIRVFDLPTLRHVSILRPVHRDRLGPFSRAVSGIILHNLGVVFASLDGDVHVAGVRGPSSRRAHVGNVVNDGTLVDFTGCSRWWVGLYAGVPGRAFQVWNGQTEELVFVGGSLTDPESVLGWQLLIELAESVGRVRVSTQQDDDDTAGVACTGQRMMVLDLHHGGGIALGDEQEMDRGVFVDSVDVSSNGLFMVIDGHGLARVCRVRTLEEVCRFNVRLGGGRLHGSMNTGYALVCTGGVVRVWHIETGGYLYGLRDRMGQHANDLVADDERVAGCSSETGIHLWSFSA